MKEQEINLSSELHNQVTELLKIEALLYDISKGLSELSLKGQTKLIKVLCERELESIIDIAERIHRPADRSDKRGIGARQLRFAPPSG